MIVDVAVLPSSVRQPEHKVCLVIDVLLASSSLVSMFEAGALNVRLASSPAEAVALAELDRENSFLCGEHGDPLAGQFDAGDSPYELARTAFGRRDVIYSAPDASRAVAAVVRAPSVLVGGFVNAEAAATYAIREAQRAGCGVELVCAGNDGGSSLGLEDLVCAGYIVDLMGRAGLHSRLPEDPDAGHPQNLALEESAVAAVRVMHSFLGEAGERSLGRDTVLRALQECRNGRRLRRLGLEKDLLVCAAISTSRIVPVLVDNRGALVLAPTAAPIL